MFGKCLRAGWLGLIAGCLVACDRPAPPVPQPPAPDATSPPQAPTSDSPGVPLPPTTEVPPAYEVDWSQHELGALSSDFLVLGGEFELVELDGKRVLKLGMQELDAFGVMFGPTHTMGVQVEAQVLATARGRRMPTFSVGSNGVSGYQLRVAGVKRQLELLRDEQIVATVDYVWSSGVWTHLQLRVDLHQGYPRVRAKAWAQGQDEPADWLLVYDDRQEITPGRATIWGAPYAETPIYFDGLRVTFPR